MVVVFRQQRRYVHLTHWGAAEIESDGRQLTSVRPWREDPAPSRILENLAAAHRHPARIDQPYIRQGWLEHGPAAAARGSDVFVPVSRETALDLLATELRRDGPDGMFGGSYGWASAGRFHHAQSQLHRFLNCLGGYVRSVNTYSYGSSSVLLPHVVGDVSLVMAGATAWPVIAENTDLLVAFGGLSPKNSAVASGGMGRHTMAPAARRARGTAGLAGPGAGRDARPDRLAGWRLRARVRIKRRHREPPPDVGSASVPGRQRHRLLHPGGQDRGHAAAWRRIRLRREAPPLPGRQACLLVRREPLPSSPGPRPAARGVRQAADRGGARPVLDRHRAARGHRRALDDVGRTRRVRPGVVQLSTGAWYDPDPADPSFCRYGNPNVLTADRPSSALSQGTTGQLAMVEIEPYAAPPPGVSGPSPASDGGADQMMAIRSTGTGANILWEHKHGRAPTSRELLHIASDATLLSRQGKDAGPVDWHALAARWDATLGELAGIALSVSNARGPVADTQPHAGGPEPGASPSREAQAQALVSRAASALINVLFWLARQARRMVTSLAAQSLSPWQEPVIWGQRDGGGCTAGRPTGSWRGRCRYSRRGWRRWCRCRAECRSAVRGQSG